jgi:hypothetical protein
MSNLLVTKENNERVKSFFCHWIGLRRQWNTYSPHENQLWEEKATTQTRSYQRS